MFNQGQSTFVCEGGIFHSVRLIKCIPDSRPRRSSGLQYSGSELRIVAVSAVLHLRPAVGGKAGSASWPGGAE